VVGFSLVRTAWYGVNFVLGAGLHGCGFGGGVPHVFTELGLQGLIAAAAVRYVASGAAEAERAARQSLPRADQSSHESFPSPSQPESQARTGTHHKRPSRTSPAHGLLSRLAGGLARRDLNSARAMGKPAKGEKQVWEKVEQTAHMSKQRLNERVLHVCDGATGIR
jgi:hypothetical protein